MPPVKKNTINYADLSDDEKAALRREIAAEDQANRDAVDPLAAARDAALLSLMDTRDHLRDCPSGEREIPDGHVVRVESYGSIKPKDDKKNLPERPVTVVRCITCGGTTVLDELVDVVRARVDAAAADVLAAA
jgi:hypothetical protein